MLRIVLARASRTSCASAVERDICHRDIVFAEGIWVETAGRISGKASASRLGRHMFQTDSDGAKARASGTASVSRLAEIYFKPLLRFKGPIAIL